MLRIVDEFDKSLGRKLIRQPLHALTAGGSDLGDLRHGQRTKQREASHEAECTAPIRSVGHGMIVPRVLPHSE